MSLRDAMAGVKQGIAETDEDQQEAAPKRDESTVTRSRAVTSGRSQKGAAAAKPQAKSKDPDYEKVTVYLRKDTRKQGERKWEDANGGDLSDLLNTLLGKYIG